MAKIEMDVSEYEAMKENKRLLEDSLKRERELQASIEKLNQEKIKAYEEAQCKIVQYVNTTVVEDLIISDWDSLFSLEQSVNKYVSARERYGTNSFATFSHIHPSLLEEIKRSVKKNKTTKTEVSKIETTNLEVYKQEIESKLREEFGETIANAESKIEKDSFYEGKIIKLQDKVEELSVVNTDLTKEKAQLSKSLDSIKKELDKIKTKFVEKENKLEKTTDEVSSNIIKIESISNDLGTYRSIILDVAKLAQHDSMFNNREVLKQIRERVKNYNGDK